MEINMRQLETLAGAGYRHGYTNQHGADSTVNGIEYALQHLTGDTNASHAETARNSAEHAAYALESRLYATYCVEALALIKLGRGDDAKAAYQRAQTIVELSKQHGPSKIPSIDPQVVEETLAVIERRLRSIGVTL
jgi:hypothetical protein